MSTFQLFFGLSCPDGSIISKQQFDSFELESIQPHFDSFTIQHGEGFWLGSSEPIRIVSISDWDNEATRSKIQAIASSYKLKFNQQSVGLIVLPGMAFL